MNKKYLVILFNIFKLIILLALIISLIIKLKVGYAKESWGITEFLINYEGGFIRRGLIGQIFYSLHSYLGLSPYYLIIIFCLICFFTLIAFFIKYFHKFQIPNTLLICSFLFSGPIVNNFWLRKDCFLLLCFIIIIKISTSDKLKNYIKFIFINFTASFAILSHESFIFWGILPIYLIILGKNTSKYGNLRILIKDFTKISIYLLPAYISFVACFYYNGTKEIREIIWNSWNDIPFPYHLTNDSRGAIDPIGETFQDYGLPKFMELFTTSSIGIPAFLGLLFEIIVSVTLCYILINKSVKRDSEISNGKIILGLLLYQTTGIIILSVLGCDYGRWMFFWIGSSMIMYFLFPIQTLKNIAISINIISNYIINSGKKIQLNKINPIILFLICGVNLAHWNITFYLPATPIGNIINPLLYLLNLPNTMIWGI